MSTDMIAYVLGLSTPELTRPQKHLLLVLAYHTNHHTGLAFPGYRLLAQECLLSIRQIINLIHRLEKDGWIEAKRGQGRGHLTAFRIVAPEKVIHRKGEAPERMSTREKVKSEPEKVKSSASPLNEVEEKREKQPSALAPEKGEMRSRFWCGACGFAIQACQHRLVEV